MSTPVAVYDSIDPTFFVAEVDGFRLFRSINAHDTDIHNPIWLIEGAGSFHWTSLDSMRHHINQTLCNQIPIPPRVISRFLPFAELVAP